MTELQAKRLARIRDNGKCLICRRPGAFALHGHHILPKSLYPARAADPANLATLCLCCHLGLVHGGKISDGGDPEGRWKAWKNFLTNQIIDGSRHTAMRAARLHIKINGEL